MHEQVRYASMLHHSRTPRVSASYVIRLEACITPFQVNGINASRGVCNTF